MAKEITDNNFEQEVLNSSKAVLVDFWAPWCGPCRQLSPVVEELSKDLADQITVYKCNIDEQPETPSKYAVRGIPTLMIFKNGKLVNSKVGALPKSALYEWVRSNL